LIQEEENLEDYKQMKEKIETNAYVFYKEDIDNPIFRVDIMMDKVSPKQVYDALVNYKDLPTWFNKCASCKIVEGGNGNKGSEVFSTVFKASSQPLKNREFIHRRYLS
jgi:hypothetical protein